MESRCPTLDQGERLDRLTRLQVQQQGGAVVHHRETLHGKKKKHRRDITGVTSQA